MDELMEDRRLAEKYVPRLRYDRAEPYGLKAVGYTVHRKGGRSSSCSLQLNVEPGEATVEYAFYYDFDIQHMYDLEHVFVTADREGKVIGVLGSFHGKFLNNLIEGETRFEGTHVVLYVQPGKHAFMPDPRYFRLFPDRDRCCKEFAGREGLLIAPVFEGRLSTDEAFDRKVERYIQQNHAFLPTWEFVEEYPQLCRAEDVLMPWPELDALIVERITDWKRRIDGYPSSAAGSRKALR